MESVRPAVTAESGERIFAQVPRCSRTPRSRAARGHPRCGGRKGDATRIDFRALWIETSRQRPALAAAEGQPSTQYYWADRNLKTRKSGSRTTRSSDVGRASRTRTGCFQLPCPATNHRWAEDGLLPTADQL